MSTFSGLSVALSSLYAQRRGLDVTGQNIANANTDGYSRQRVEMAAIGGTAAPAMFSTRNGSAGGVTVTGVTRMQDGFLEARGRLEHAQNAYLAEQSQVLSRVQQIFGEPSGRGVQAQLSDLWSSFHDLANEPGNAAGRSQVISRATALADTMHGIRASLGSLYSTTREQVDTYAADINTTSAQIASLNQTIVAANQTGITSNELADQRDRLVMHLSDLTGATAMVRVNGAVDVFVGGSGLVVGNTAREIKSVGARQLDDIASDPVALEWNDTAGVVVSVGSGRVGAMLQTLSVSGALHTNAVALDGVAAALADTVNTQHAKGYDRSGNPGGDLFTSSTGDPINAHNLVVAFTDGNLVAAAVTNDGAGGGTLDGDNADLLAGLVGGSDGPDGKYRQLIVRLGVDAQSTERRADTQATATDDVDAARQAQSGVNLDEEMTNLIAFQRAYQAAARVIATIDSVLDTLINRTGR